MDLLLVGTSHHVASIGRRESVARRVADAGTWLAAVRETVPAVAETLLLSTCHRVECYVVAADIAAAEAQLRAVLGEDLAMEGGTAPLYALSGQTAVEHLCRVACGLDSLVVGEAEIAGQIRRAAALARTAGTLGPHLERIVAGAYRASGRARSETHIARGVFSAASAGVALGAHLLGSFAEREALVIGAGEAGRQALARLARSRPRPSRVWVASRSARHAQDAAAACGAEALDLTGLAGVLPRVDFVVAALRAPTAGVDASVWDRASSRPLVIVDLSVPRVVPVDVGTRPGVELRTVDDLGDIARRSAANRQAEVPHVERIIAAEAARAYDLLRARVAAVAARRGD